MALGNGGLEGVTGSTPPFFKRSDKEKTAGVPIVDFSKFHGEVERYGAVVDDFTDDTFAIQAAIDSTHDVLLGEDTSVITAALVMDNAGQRMTGHGKGTSILRQTVINKNGISITANNVYVGHLQVKDITQNDANEYQGIIWEDVDGVTIEHVKIDTSDDSGIRCGYDSGGGDPGASSTNSRILYCDITNVTAGAGIEIIGAEDVVVHGCNVEGVWENGIRVVGSKRVRVSENNIEHFAESGAGEGITVAGGTTPGPSISDAIQNIVTGNIIRLNTSIVQTGSRIGIFIGEDAIDVIVSDNFIDVTDTNGDVNVSGILLRDVSAATEATNNCIISNNIIKGDLEVAIRMQDTATNIKITGNILEGFNDDGISLASTDNPIISGNTIRGAAQTANAIALVTSIKDGTITGNAIYGCGRGFDIRGVCLRTLIDGNNLADMVLTGGSAYGFFISGTNIDELVITNNIISNALGVSGDTIQGIHVFANGSSDTIYAWDNRFIYAAATTQVFVEVDSGQGNVEVRHTAADLTTELVAATNVITAEENGKIFYLNAVGGFTSTLPGPVLGLKYKFIVKTAPTTAYIITTNAGANILEGTFLDIVGELQAIAAQDTLNFVASVSLVGDSLEVESDGDNWYCTALSKADGGITVSVT